MIDTPLEIDYDRLALLLADKKCRYDDQALSFFSDDEFITAIKNAYSATEQTNVIDSYISFLKENYEHASNAIDYLKSCLPASAEHEAKYKKIIVNFNGTACPAYIRSSHDQHLFNNLGKQGTAVKNIPGVGIDAEKPTISNLVDLGNAESIPTQLQEILDYIQHHADDECEIEILGHSRGAVEAIILARIVSQKYPNVKVIAHDPVPGDKVVPFLQGSYYKKVLDVSHFLDTEPHSRSIESILNDEHLSIRGSLMVPWQKDETRADFEFLSGPYVYNADYFFPVELPGFHNTGIYDNTDVDYSVFWDNFPLISEEMKRKNKDAHQGEELLDSERPAIQGQSKRAYYGLVQLFTEHPITTPDDSEHFAEQLSELKRNTFEEMNKSVLVHSYVQKNPGYQLLQTEEQRPLPTEFDEFDKGVNEDFFDYLKKNTNPDGSYKESGIDLLSLLEKLVYLPSEISNQDLLFLTLHWVDAITRNNYPPEIIENLQDNLWTNPDFAHRVKAIGQYCGFDDICQQIHTWQAKPNPAQIEQEIQQAITQCPNPGLQELWSKVALNLPTPDKTSNLDDILEKYRSSAPKTINKSPSEVDVGTTVAVLCIIGFAAGALIGAGLVASGVFAPFGLGVFGILGLAATMGGGLALVSGVAGYAAIKADEQSDNALEDEDSEVECESSLKALAKLGGTHTDTSIRKVNSVTLSQNSALNDTHEEYLSDEESYSDLPPPAF